MWAGQFYSRGAYTIFPHTEAENDTFPFLRRAGMGYFRPGVRKNRIRTIGENQEYLRSHGLFPRGVIYYFLTNFILKYLQNL